LSEENGCDDGIVYRENRESPLWRCRSPDYAAVKDFRRLLPESHAVPADNHTAKVPESPVRQNPGFVWEEITEIVGVFMVLVKYYRLKQFDE
jgi:hypothetical protein